MSHLPLDDVSATASTGSAASVEKSKSDNNGDFVATNHTDHLDAATRARHKELEHARFVAAQASAAAGIGRPLKLTSLRTTANIVEPSIQEVQMATCCCVYRTLMPRLASPLSSVSLLLDFQFNEHGRPAD